MDFQLTGGATSQDQDCLTLDYPANREVYRVFNLVLDLHSGNFTPLPPSILVL